VNFVATISAPPTTKATAHDCCFAQTTQNIARAAGSSV